MNPQHDDSDTDELHSGPGPYVPRNACWHHVGASLKRNCAHRRGQWQPVVCRWPSACTCMYVPERIAERKQMMEKIKALDLNIDRIILKMFLKISL